MEPIVGLEDWFENSDKNIRSLDELFAEPVAEEEIPLEAAETDDPDAPDARLIEPVDERLTPEDLATARAESGDVLEDEEKVEWFDRWATVVSESAVAALDDLQKLSDALSAAQGRAIEDAELVSELRNTIEWQSKMSGPAPPFARPEAGTKVTCLLCETEGECDGKWDEKTGVHVCARCVEYSKTPSLVITADGMAAIGLGPTGTATTVYNWYTNAVSWGNPTYTVTTNARDLLVNASWTGTVPEPAAEPPVEEKQEIVPEAVKEQPVMDEAVKFAIEQLIKFRDGLVPGATTDDQLRAIENLLDRCGFPRRGPQADAEEASTEAAPVEVPPTEPEPEPEPDQPPVDSSPSEYRISLPDKLHKTLLEGASSEDGLGYQTANIMMASGKLYENITVLNCEEIIVTENINPEEIELIEIVNADATEA